MLPRSVIFFIAVLAMHPLSATISQEDSLNWFDISKIIAGFTLIFGGLIWLVLTIGGLIRGRTFRGLTKKQRFLWYLGFIPGLAMAVFLLHGLWGVGAFFVNEAKNEAKIDSTAVAFVKNIQGNFGGNFDIYYQNDRSYAIDTTKNVGMLLLNGEVRELSPFSIEFAKNYSSMMAKSPQEVGIIIFIHGPNEKKVGRYGKKGNAYQWHCYLNMIEYPSRTKISGQNIWGDSPVESSPNGSEQCGRKIPNRRIIDGILEMRNRKAK